MIDEQYDNLYGIEREKLRDALVELLIKESNNHGIYSLTANWGEGKTYFVKNLLKKLSDDNINRINKKENDKGRIPIYFDAWKHDKYEKPLDALLINMLNINESSSSSIDISKLIVELGKFILNTLSNGISGELITMLEKSEVNEGYPFQEDVYTLNDAYKKLSRFMVDNRIVLIIDELDRANPEFSLKLIEVVKHFFNDIPVLLVFEHNSMYEIIKHKYGISNPSLYLEKVIDQKFELPKFNYYSNVAFNDYNLIANGMSNHFNGYQSDIIIKCAEKFNISVRELKKYYSNLINNNINPEDNIHLVLICILEIKKLTNYEEYYNYNILRNYTIFIDECYSDIKSIIEIISTSYSVKDINKEWFIEKINKDYTQYASNNRLY